MGALFQQLCIAADNHQEIIEVVGDPPGEPSDRLHPLRVFELFLQQPALGNVFDEDFEPKRVSALVT